MTSAEVLEGDLAAPSEVNDRFRWRPFWIASALYFFASFGVWWNIWSTSPTNVTTCGCGDSALFLWFFEWPAYALSHGLSPLFSSAMSYPSGVNLLANTSELGFGVPLAPISWAFGPIASMNLSLLLAPALSAMAMFALASRWVRWAPASFAAGLLYGFSPMTLVALSDAHLMVGMSASLPLIALCLDELLRRQKARPVLVGICLGLTVVFEFFIGTEMLVIAALGVVVCGVLIGLNLLGHLDLLRERWRHAAIGLGTGGLVSLVLLAYPAWFALAGPGAIKGPVWPTLSLGIQGATLKALFVQTAATKDFASFTHRVGGSQGVTLSGQYFGWGIAAVSSLGLALRWRDRRMWMLAILAVVAAWTSLGVSIHHWAPWNLLGRRPIFENIIPSRFLVLTYLALAVMMATTADTIRRSVRARFDRSRHAEQRLGLGSFSVVLISAVAGAAILGAGVYEPVSYTARMLPISAERVVLPEWFVKVAPSLPARQVLLVLPVPFAMIESSMAWQAENRMHWSMVGGGGPNGVIERAGREAPGQAVIGDVSFAFRARKITPISVQRVRRALEGWGVTKIVIPDQRDLPLYDQITSTPTAAGLMTLASGIPPHFEAKAWVWDLADAKQPRLVSAEDFVRCTLAVAPHGKVAVRSAVACLLATHPESP